MTFDSSDDSLKRYLEDIRKTKPLCREEEQTLFRLCEQGNSSARSRLIQSNMRFVLKVALQYKGCPIPLPDLVNEGSMGLIRAIESFDYSRGLKFISYAVWWIKAYITRAINESGNIIRLPANQHLRVRKALKAKNRGEEISEDIRELIQLGEKGISFDQPLGTDSKTSYSEILEDHSTVSPESSTEVVRIEGMARELIDNLPTREAQVIQGLYGINYESPQTLREVGESLNISHERVRQLRDQALRRIRKTNSKEFLKDKFEGYLEAIA